MSDAEDKSFSSLPVGTTVSFERHISGEDVQAFADLSGDYNPLHVDVAYAKKTSFGTTVVHGMLLGALVSRLVGMHLPGARALLLKESLEFKKPVHPGDRIKVEGEVVSTSQATHILEVRISISVAQLVVATGEVLVQVRE